VPDVRVPRQRAGAAAARRGEAVTETVVLTFVVIAVVLLTRTRKPAERWQVRAAELHSQWLERSMVEEGWEPFAFVERETSVRGETREGVPADRLNGYVLLRRRSARASAMAMTPDDTARFHGSPG
jgi:hypothetical protein